MRGPTPIRIRIRIPIPILIPKWALRAEVRVRLSKNTGGSGGIDQGWGGMPASGGAWSGGAGTSSSGGSGGGSGATGPVFTGTNTQIPGVDEPDFMKTDGQHFYIV